MPSRNSDHHRKDRAVYDDEDPYRDDYSYERPRTSRRVSRSAHEYDTAEPRRHRSRRYDSPSPVRPSRTRSEDYRPSRPSGRGRHDSYSEYSDSEDDRRRSRGHGQSDRRRHSKVSGSSRSTSGMFRRDTDKGAMIQAAASAAVVAGATEAWRMRNEKTSWSRKGTKMATAAAGAAAFAAFNNNSNGAGSGSRNQGSSKKDALQATLGGLLVNRLANGGSRK